jgi:hypothetical protein
MKTSANADLQCMVMHLNIMFCDPQVMFEGIQRSEGNKHHCAPHYCNSTFITCKFIRKNDTFFSFYYYCIFRITIIIIIIYLFRKREVHYCVLFLFCRCSETEDELLRNWADYRKFAWCNIRTSKLHLGHVCVCAKYGSVSEFIYKALEGSTSSHYGSVIYSISF